MTDDSVRPEQHPHTTVVCIGNSLMGDDGLGAAVARELRKDGGSEGLCIVERPNADMGLIGHFSRPGRVIVVDAMDTGSPPGAVFRFDPDDVGVTELRSNNIHGMGVGFLMTSARLAGHDPDVTVYGVQVGDVRPNPDTLSEDVAAAVPEVARMVLGDIAGRPPAPKA